MHANSTTTYLHILGHRVGTLCWRDGTGWRSAWNVDGGAWHAVRAHAIDEGQAHGAAATAASAALRPGGAQERYRKRKAQRLAPAPAPVRDTTQWQQLEQSWMRSQADLQRLRARQAEARASAAERRELVERARLAIDEAQHELQVYAVKALRAQRRTESGSAGAALLAQAR